MNLRCLPYCWLAVYVRGYQVGYAQAGELYELGGPAVQFDGLVDVVFPYDALGVVLLEPSLPCLRQLDPPQAFSHSSVTCI